MSGAGGTLQQDAETAQRLVALIPQYCDTVQYCDNARYCDTMILCDTAIQIEFCQ